MRDNEEEFHPIIEYFSPAPGRNILGSGEECPRLRGGSCPAPGKRSFGSEEEAARLRGVNVFLLMLIISVL